MNENHDELVNYLFASINYRFALFLNIVGAAVESYSDTATCFMRLSNEGSSGNRVRVLSWV